MATKHHAAMVPPVITATELAGRLREGSIPRLVDVREPEEFAAGHIPGAVNMPLSQFTATFARLPRAEEIVLVCRSGNRSGMAQGFLRQQGYTGTRNLVGGMLAWDGPVVR